MVRQTLISASLVCLMAGCAAPPPPAPMATAPQPVAAAPGRIDGIYKGTVTPTKIANRRCPRPGEATARIRDGVLTRRWNNQTLTATVQPDGTFSGQGGRAFLTGKVGGGVLEFDVVGESCGYHFALTQV